MFWGEKRNRRERRRRRREEEEEGGGFKPRSSKPRYGTWIFSMETTLSMDACLCYEFYMDIRDPSMILIQEFLGYDC